MVVPNRPLTLLPVHAAGPTRGDATPWRRYSVPDRVISSYTPTLGRPDPGPAARPRPFRSRHLTIGMPTTPGLPPLPAVRAELEIVARHFPARQATSSSPGRRRPAPPSWP